IGLGVGVYLFVKGFSWFRLKRLIENTPTSKIRSIAMGLVEIYGSVVPYKNLLKSPLTGSDCVYYFYKVEEKRNSGNSTRWVTIKSGKDRVPFMLKDETGQVLVDSEDANIDIPPNLSTRSRSGHSKTIRSFLEKNHIRYKLLGFNKSLRFKEYHIAPEDKLYIMGSAGDNPFVKNAAAQKNEEDIMIHKGEDDKIFYISDRHEKDIIASLKWKVVGGLFGGGALMIGCLVIIFLYLGMF
ncbi:MAG: GIDE domain-containing protein, partial [Candidatus Nanoarchaeia archaeon]